jgi:hypothetical protein
MSAIDYVRRASRPTGMADALAFALDVMHAKCIRQESELSSLRAHVSRFEQIEQGYYTANQDAFERLAKVLQENARLQAELAARKEAA